MIFIIFKLFGEAEGILRDINKNTIGSVVTDTLRFRLTDGEADIIPRCIAGNIKHAKY